MTDRYDDLRHKLDSDERLERDDEARAMRRIRDEDMEEEDEREA